MNTAKNKKSISKIIGGYSFILIWACILVAYLIIKVIPAKTLVKFSLGEFYIGKKAAAAAPVEEVKDAFEEANK